ncbi:phosphatase PAP2 family protein [Vibrio fluvialis]|nr:phosphatase PAP2 family protein [Vibrio fluvialis]
MSDKMEFKIPRTNWSDEWQSIKCTLAQDKIIYGYVLVLVLGIYVLSSFGSFDTKLQYQLSTYLGSMMHTISVTFLLWCVYFYIHMLKNRIAHPTIYLLKAILAFLSPLSRPLACLLILMCVSLTLSSYTYLKSIIPDLHFYQFDALFYQLDKAIHGGISPWEFTHALFSHPLATLVINFLYNLWFLIIWGVLVFFLLYRKNQTVRLRFFLTFVSCWIILGGMLGTALSSAGPCYAQLLNPLHDYYVPLLHRLAEQNQWLIDAHLPSIWALNTQDMLWQEFLARDQGIGSGISAMPSMHVAMAVLVALSISVIHPIWGRVAWGFALMIQIGSVHLAWHYAIDGYASTVLTILIWQLVTKFVRAHSVSEGADNITTRNGSNQHSD